MHVGYSGRLGKRVDPDDTIQNVTYHHGSHFFAKIKRAWWTILGLFCSVKNQLENIQIFFILQIVYHLTINLSGICFV